MKRSLIFSLLILGVAAGIAAALFHFRSRPVEVSIKPVAVPVEVEVATRRDVPVVIESQGVIEAKVLTKAASEVAGKVIEVSPAFEVGGQFEQGDVLLRIDPADYAAAVATAESAVASAALRLQIDEAKAVQSLRDWKKLGRGEEASSLVRREPQLASARSDLAAAEARLAKARRDLERTVLRAPYDGRIIQTLTDLASYVGIGTPVAEFYASNALEVRLPIALGDLHFLDLGNPETAVTLTASVGQRWEGARIVRKDSQIDRRSRSLNLVAALNPLRVPNNELLVPGLFVQASIVGKTFKDVFEVPRRALQDDQTLILVQADDTLMKRPVTVLRKEMDTILIGNELQAGERVCVSFLPVYRPGMKVSVRDSNSGSSGSLQEG